MLSDKEFVLLANKIIKEKPEVFEALLEFERTKKIPKFTYKRRYNFTLDPELFKKFKNYCEKKGIKMSTRIEQHLMEDINK